MKRGKPYQKDLVKYRLELANEMLNDARLLKDNGGSDKIYRTFPVRF